MLSTSDARIREEARELTERHQSFAPRALKAVAPYCKESRGKTAKLAKSTVPGMEHSGECGSD